MDAPSPQPSDTFVQAPFLSSPRPTQVQTVRVTDYYIAFVAPTATREPTKEEYNEMNRRITAYFSDDLIRLYADDSNIEFVSIDSSNDFTLYGAAAGIPRPEFNIYMNFNYTDVTYRTTTGLMVVPTVDETFGDLRNSITVNFILQVVRNYTGTPFESTNEVIFAASDFVGPPAF
jgi:hypothetical protein